MQKIFFSVFACLIFTLPCIAGNNRPSVSDKREKVLLITDRSLYIAREQIQFNAMLMQGKDPAQPVESDILYCEIITPDGNKVVGSKYAISNNQAAGCIAIPENIITGTYYLRAYTKAMRNYGPETYGYNQVRIVNPFRDEVLSKTDISEKGLPNVIQGESADIKDIVSVYADKSLYAPHDSVSLWLSASPRTEDDETMSLKTVSLSVIPGNQISEPVRLQIPQSTIAGKGDYFAETRGLSVTGKLTEIPSGKPVIDKKVNLSIIGEGRDFMSVRTDSIGRFFFAMPMYTGSRDLFVCAEKIDSLKVKIWVDNDFCSLPFRLPSPLFKLSDSEVQYVRNMVQNVQITNAFYTDTVQKPRETKTEKYAFYGKPSTIIYIDKYIQLPTLEEYFNELPSEVRVRKRKGQPRFDILGTRGVSLYDPLVMVDYVAVDEPAKVLAASPQNISRIEVVNDDYIKGGQTYGGVISIISKKGDFAGIDLPSAGIFISFSFLASDNCNETMMQATSNMPDTRNTLLWKPGIKIKAGSTRRFTFSAPDTPGNYTIVLEGINSKGEFVQTTSSFVVR